jgi:hypothetical protein
MTIALNLKDWSRQRKTDMIYGRSAFGICAIGSYIYAVGGVTSQKNSTDSCERYDMEKD